MPNPFIKALKWFSKGGTTVVADVVDPSQIKVIKYPFTKNPPTTRTALSTTSSYAIEQTQDYDLSVIDRFIDQESMVFQTFSKIEEKAMNGGWQIVSKDQEALDWIRQRFADMAAVTNTPTEIFFRETIQDLVRYSNSFLYKHRDRLASSGKSYRDINGNLIEPIAAYIRLDPSSVVPVRDKKGNITAYDIGITAKQAGLISGTVMGPGATKKRVKASEIVHIYAFKNPRNNLGTPYIWPVKDDIRVLRKMEENVELLIQRHIFPLFHYIIGTETAPALPEEIEKVVYDLELMPTEGGFVTPERHKIDVLGAGGTAVDASKYLEHFQTRVIMGLGIGAVSLGLGGGASRASSEVIDRSLVEKAKLFQELFSSFLEDLVLKELLSEGGFEVYDVTKYTRVHIQFEEIDTDLLIKKQTNIANLFNNQMITHDEARQEMGRDVITPDSDQWNNLQFYTFGVAVQSEYAIKEQAAADRAKGAAKEAAAKNGPSNQYGKKLSPKRQRDNINDSVIKYLKNSEHASRFSDMLELRYENTRKDILAIMHQASLPLQNRDHTSLQLTFGVARNDMEKSSYSYIYEAFSLGLSSAVGPEILNERHTLVDSHAQNILEHYNHYLSKTMTNLEKDVMNIVDNLSGPSDSVASELTSLFDIRKHYIYGASVTGIAKAFNFGKALAYKSRGHEKVYLKTNEEGCQECGPLNGKEVDVRHIAPEDLPPHHRHCECTIELEKVETNGKTS
jgi:hypothetical protein